MKETQTNILGDLQQVSTRLSYITDVQFDNFVDDVTEQQQQQQHVHPQHTTLPQQNMNMLSQHTTLPQHSIQQTVQPQTYSVETQQASNTHQDKQTVNGGPLPLHAKLRNKPLAIARPIDTYYTVEEAVDLHKHYIDNDMPGTFAQLLAKEAVFGQDIMQQCTLNGSKKHNSLPQNGLYQIKKIIFDHYPQFCQSPELFEPVWSRCQKAIERCCGRLRRKTTSTCLHHNNHSNLLSVNLYCSNISVA